MLHHQPAARWPGAIDGHWLYGGMSTPQCPARPARPLVELVVESTEWLSPHLVRVVAGGSGFAQFTDNGSTDHYVKIQFEDVTRTYTLRWVDAAAQRLAIDFVVHGDQGLEIGRAHV